MVLPEAASRRIGVPDRTASPPPPASSAAARTRLARDDWLVRLLRDPSALVGLALVVLISSSAALAPMLAPHDPTAANFASRLSGPTAGHPLGTDNLGRDLLSRLLHGGRLSLSAAGLAAVLIVLVGLVVGMAAGYWGGALDGIVMRVVDVLLAFPSLILALAVVGVLGPGLPNILAGMTCVWWASYARLVRGLVLSLRERQYVRAAAALGASDSRILVRHVLPNVVPSVIVLATLELGQLILAVAGLSFLGLGVQPPTPEWGAMINQGRAFLHSAPGLILYPGLAAAATVLGFNLLGDGLRDALDPRLRSGS